MALAPTVQVSADLYVHVRIMLGVILGLAVARLLGGVAGVMQHLRRERLPWIHLGWVAWTLLEVVGFWWWEFRLSRMPHWDLGLYLFMFAYASMYFLLAAMLFPEGVQDRSTYEDLFMNRRGWFFGLAALTELMDVADTWLKGGGYAASLGLVYPVGVAAMVALCAVAARTRNILFHRLFVAAALIYEASFFALYYRELI